MGFNKKRIILNTIIAALVIIVAASCGNNAMLNQTNRSYIEYMNRISDQSTDFQNSVFKVYCIADYQNFYIHREAKLKKQEITTEELDFFPTNLKTESVFGTATLISKNKNHLTFLSCYHFMDYPDTVISYYYDEIGRKTDFISNISIKRDQTQFIRDDGFNGVITLLAKDTINDISILGATVKNVENETNFYSIVLAADKTVTTGTEVFSFGYPAGYRMMTRALLSKSFPKKPNTFIIDASFHKGYSGAPIVIFNMQKDKFELAGIITSASAEAKNILVPESRNHDKTYNTEYPYTDYIYADVIKNINYGITFTANITEIKNLYIKHRYQLKSRGHNLDRIFIDE